jgi:glycine hydroxymethyltransferase
MRKNFSGRLCNIVAYEVDRESTLTDLTRSRRSPESTRGPRLLLAGWSAYPRQLDFAHFCAIADELDALLMVDMAYFAGLVAAGLPPTRSSAAPTSSRRRSTRRGAARAVR